MKHKHLSFVIITQAFCKARWSCQYDSTMMQGSSSVGASSDVLMILMQKVRLQLAAIGSNASRLQLSLFDHFSPYIVDM